MAARTPPALATVRTGPLVVTGTVALPGSEPVAGVTVDLFAAGPDGERSGYLSSAQTGPDGRFDLNLPTSGCYVIVMIVPVGARFVGGGRYRESKTCAGPGDRIEGLGAMVAPSNDPSSDDEPSVLTGRTLANDGRPATGLTIDLFAATGDGSRGSYLRSTATAEDGTYRFEVPRGCFVLVAIAPSDTTFVDAGRFEEEHLCPSGGSVAAADVFLAVERTEPTPTDSTVLTATEREIVRLTNALRTDPDGPLARRKPMPVCVAEGFYAIEIDPASGHPRPAPALAVSEAVTVELARAWAIDMQLHDDFAHRPSESQQRIYDRLGIGISAWGENIAWFSGYDPGNAARIHFEGWRESDSGHYCSLVTGRFSHVGVGEHRVGSESWAVQNFYSP